MKKRAQEVFTEKKAEDFLKKYLPVAKHIMSKDIVQAQKFCKKHKFPIMLKLISPQAIHKTEVNGVRKVHNDQELKKEFTNILNIAKKKKLNLEGILVQKFIPGQQLAIGLKNNATFGHVIMFGIGGIFVEAIKDIEFRSCPITKDDAESMINSLKLGGILTNKREPLNLKLLKKLLIITSYLPKKYPNIQELDINPLILNKKEAKVVDARIVFNN